MRGFLAFVVLLVVALVAAALAIVPTVVRPIVVDQVRTALPFRDQPLDVQVELNPVGLLFGTIDSVHVTGSGLQTATATIGSLDLTFHDVSTTTRSFASVKGTLGHVVLPYVQDSELVLDTITIDGSADAVVAVVDLDLRAGLSLVGNAFADAGIPADSLELVDGGVKMSLFGQPAIVGLGVEDGSLVLLDVAGGGPMSVVQPAPDDPWRVTDVSVRPTGMTIKVAIGPLGVLRPA